MKKIVLLLGVLNLFSSCTKSQKIEISNTGGNEVVQELTQEMEGKFGYVNSPEGLRIRKEPSLDTEKISSLKNKEKVEIISILNPVEIDSISSNWLQIKTNENIEGYVFGGYIEESEKKVEMIQMMEGSYTKSGLDDIQKISIHYLGNEKIRIESTLPNLEALKEENLDHVIDKDLIQNAGDRGGLSQVYRVYFENGKIYYRYTEDRGDYDDDFNLIYESHIDQITELKKL